MVRCNKSQPMPVKYWSFAGLMLTYWCNARCASCYVCSSPSAACPDGGTDMSVETGLAFWEGLQSASPHGCRIHIGGGEPFGRWEILSSLVRQAHRAGLGPLEAVETNAFWAGDERIIRDRLAALDAAGMGRLTISADPYHQQFVPIDRVRLLARVGEEVLGPGRVRVRWCDWAREGFDTDSLPPPQRQDLFARYARKGRDRLTGRAAVKLAGLLPLQPAETFAESPCWGRLLRGRHVHIDGEGIVCPGACAGIVLGRLPRGGGHKSGSISRIWQNLREDFADMSDAPPRRPVDVLDLLVRSGPLALMREAGRIARTGGRMAGYVERPEGYAGKCHLCWDVRRWLFENGYFRNRLGPAGVYRP